MLKKQAATVISCIHANNNEDDNKMWVVQLTVFIGRVVTIRINLSYLQLHHRRYTIRPSLCS